MFFNPRQTGDGLGRAITDWPAMLAIRETPAANGRVPPMTRKIRDFFYQLRPVKKSDRGLD